MNLSTEVREIIEQLRYLTPKVPSEALNKAMTMQDELAEVCRRAVLLTKQNLEFDGKTEITNEYFFHFYALFFLGFWGDNQTTPILIEIATGYSQRDDDIWADTFTEEFAVVIAETITEEQLHLLWIFFETERTRESWISSSIAESIAILSFLKRFDNNKFNKIITNNIIPLCESIHTPAVNRVNLGCVLLDINFPNTKNLLLKLAKLQYGIEYDGDIQFTELDVENHFKLSLTEIARRTELMYSKRNSQYTIKTLDSWPCFSQNSYKEKREYIGSNVFQMVEKRVGDKIGRNEKCPCGSGKKYKKCCL